MIFKRSGVKRKAVFGEGVSGMWTYYEISSHKHTHVLMSNILKNIFKKRGGGGGGGGTVQCPKVH